MPSQMTDSGKKNKIDEKNNVNAIITTTLWYFKHLVLKNNRIYTNGKCQMAFTTLPNDKKYQYAMYRKTSKVPGSKHRKCGKCR